MTHATVVLAYERALTSLTLAAPLSLDAPPQDVLDRIRGDESLKRQIEDYTKQSTDELELECDPCTETGLFKVVARRRSWVQESAPLSAPASPEALAGTSTASDRERFAVLQAQIKSLHLDVELFRLRTTDLTAENSRLVQRIAELEKEVQELRTAETGLRQELADLRRELAGLVARALAGQQVEAYRVGMQHLCMAALLEASTSAGVTSQQLSSDDLRALRRFWDGVEAASGWLFIPIALTSKGALANAAETIEGVEPRPKRGVKKIIGRRRAATPLSYQILQAAFRIMRDNNVHDQKDQRNIDAHIKPEPSQVSAIVPRYGGREAEAWVAAVEASLSNVGAVETATG
ncbi:hypothetical protein JCM10296v2_000558 [Rhodotorula toruloides]